MTGELCPRSLRVTFSHHSVLLLNVTISEIFSLNGYLTTQSLRPLLVVTVQSLPLFCFDFLPCPYHSWHSVGCLCTGFTSLIHEDGKQPRFHSSLQHLEHSTQRSCSVNTWWVNELMWLNWARKERIKCWSWQKPCSIWDILTRIKVGYLSEIQT